MSKKAGLRFAKTRPQLDAVTGATVPCAASGASMPCTRKSAGDGDGGQATWSLRRPARGWGRGRALPGQALTGDCFKMSRLLRDDWPTGFFEATGRQGRGDWPMAARRLAVKIFKPHASGGQYGGSVFLVKRFLGVFGLVVCGGGSDGERFA